MELVYYPDPRLRDKAKPVKKVDEALREAIPQMFKIMYRARGVGLAGPQAGLGLRVVVANLTGDAEKKDQEQVFLNPELQELAGEVKEEEGCLSLPGLAPLITRAQKVTARYTDLEGETRTCEAEGLAAKLFQHEIDHLDGVLIIDKMSPADRKQWAPLLKELEQDFKAKRKRKGGGGHGRTAL
jgi:peptide deformylase